MAKRTASPAAALGKRILDQLKELLSGEWGNFTAGDRKLLSDVAKDTAVVTIARLSGKDTKRDEAQIHAQLENMSDAAGERLRRDFWKAVGIILDGAFEFAKVV